MELSLVLIKPDAVMADHVQEILECLEGYGFEILKRKSQVLTKGDILFLYSVHMKKDFFDSLVAFLTSGPSEICIVRRRRATDVLDRLVGNQYSGEKEKTIRRLFGTDTQRNAIHSPNNTDEARREILHFFPNGEWYAID